MTDARLIDALQRWQDARNAQRLGVADRIIEEVRAWREADRAAGIKWNDR